MWRRALKWTGMVGGVLLLVLVVAAAGLYLAGGARIGKSYTVPDDRLSIPTDAASIARGKHRVDAGCTICHGDNLAGSVIFDDPSLAHIEAPNLTGGKGGLQPGYSDADFVRAIRYGVAPGGRPLMVMPSTWYYYFSDDDLGSIIAYLKTVPPVDRETPRYIVTPLGRVLVAMGAFGNLFAVESIDLDGPRPPAAAPGLTKAYGEYLVNVGECRTCHGLQLSGGKDPDPKAPPAPGLTRGGALAGWSQTDFVTAMRTGNTPRGRLNEFMPWKQLGRMTDDELAAIWLYLQSLPDGKAGN